MTWPRALVETERNEWKWQSQWWDLRSVAEGVGIEGRSGPVGEGAGDLVYMAMTSGALSWRGLQASGSGRDSLKAALSSIVSTSHM